VGGIAMVDGIAIAMLAYCRSARQLRWLGWEKWTFGREVVKNRGDVFQVSGFRSKKEGTRSPLCACRDMKDLRDTFFTLLVPGRTVRFGGIP
jgi:hypothetical protein